MSGQRRKKNATRNRGARNSVPAKEFWGSPASEDIAHDPIRPSLHPAAMVRSLSTPPLNGQERAAEHYFEAVYDKAAGSAVALAAVSGLLEL